MVLSPESLKTKEAQYKILTPSKNTGLELIIFLLPEVEFFKDMVREARAFYPYQVMWKTGNEMSAELLPIEKLDGEIALETEVGQITWKHSTIGKPFQQAIWEYRPINSRVFSRALLKAADNHRFSSLALTIAGGHHLWNIDPGSKVRPRLPDRSELIDNTNLEKAATIILDALVNEVLTLFGQASESWPPLINPSMFRNELSESLGANRWLITSNFTNYLMEIGGWKVVQAEDPRSLVLWYIQEHGLDSTSDSIVLYDKNAISISDVSVVYTLVNQGINVTHDKRGDTKVKLEGLQVSPKLPLNEWEKINIFEPRFVSPFVALVDRIEVIGYGEIPFLIREYDDPWPLTTALGEEICDRTSIIFAGNTSEFITAYREVPLLREAVVMFAHNIGIIEEWDWWRWDEGRVDYRKIEDELITQITEAYEPEMIERRGIYYALRDTSIEVFNAIHQVKMAAGRLKATKNFHAKIFAQCLKLLLRAVTSINEMLFKERDKIGRKAGLV